MCEFLYLFIVNNIQKKNSKKCIINVAYFAQITLVFSRLVQRVILSNKQDNLIL